MKSQTDKIFFSKERLDKLADLWLSPPAPPQPIPKKKVVKSA